MKNKYATRRANKYAMRRAVIQEMKGFQPNLAPAEHKYATPNRDMKNTLCKFVVLLCLCSSLALHSKVLPTNKELHIEQVLFIKNFEPDCAKDNIVWIGTSDGLYVLKGKNPQLVSGIKETHIKNIFYRAGKYWITSHNGLYYIEPNNLSVAKRIEGLQDKIIVNFYMLESQNSKTGKQNLIATDHKKRVYWVDTGTNQAIPYDELQNFSISNIADNICADEECSSQTDKENIIWLTGSLAGGLYKIDKNNARMAQPINQLSSEVVTNIRRQKNAIWISTESGGIYKASSSGDFTNVQSIEGLENKRVTELVDLGKDLLIGTIKDGAYYLHYNEPSEKAYPITGLQGESISTIALSNKYAWLAADFKGGIYRVNKEQPDKAVEVKPMRGKQILDILPFAGKLWMRVGQDELYGIDEEDLDKVVKVNTLANRAISKLQQIGNSLFFIETLKGAFVVSDNDPNLVMPIQGLKDKKINAIYFKAGLIWAETYDHEIFVIKPEQPALALPLRSMNGINIWSITKDKNENYIVGSNKGAFYVFSNDLKDAHLIPGTEGQGTTSILLLCDELWIGSLTGYQVVSLSELQKLMN